MSVEENKSIVHKLLEAQGRQDASVADELFAPNWVNNDPSLPLPTGPEGARLLLTIFKDAIPDYWVTVGDLIGEGDLVAASWIAGGTQTGPFMGVPGTGRSFKITATGFFRLKDGKLVENRVNFDALGLMQKLGVVPAPGQVPA